MSIWSVIRSVKAKLQYYRTDVIRPFTRYLRRRPATLVGLLITLSYVSFAILDVVLPQYLGVTNAGTLWSFSNLSAQYKAQPIPPQLDKGWWYLFGTTFYGIPIFPVMLASISTDIKYSLMVVVVSAFVGTIAGSFSATIRRNGDLLFMRVTDVFLSFPSIIIVILFDSIEGWSYLNISIGIMLVWWTTYARIARASTLPIRNSAFIESAVASGCSEWRLLRKHVLPNIMSLVFVQMTLDVGLVISIFATVNFLFSSLNVANAFVPEIGNLMVGFPEVGALITNPLFTGSSVNTGILLLGGVWWPIVIPGLFFVVFVLGLDLMGSGLRDFVNPKNRSH